MIELKYEFDLLEFFKARFPYLKRIVIPFMIAGIIFMITGVAFVVWGIYSATAYDIDFTASLGFRLAILFIGGIFVFGIGVLDVYKAIGFFPGPCLKRTQKKYPGLKTQGLYLKIDEQNCFCEQTFGNEKANTQFPISEIMYISFREKYVYFVQQIMPKSRRRYVFCILPVSLLTEEDKQILSKLFPNKIKHAKKAL